MATCEITGKGKMYGHNVSFSQHKTRKVFNKKIKTNISAAGIRTLKKKGIIK